MTDKEINTNKYFVELTDIGGGTIGYTVPFPEELLREIIKQNKQLKHKEQECEELEKELLTNEKIINKLMKEVDKLKQTLAEIKEIAIGIMDDDLEESSAYYDAIQILTKITEVNNEYRPDDI